MKTKRYTLLPHLHLLLPKSDTFFFFFLPLVWKLRLCFDHPDWPALIFVFFFFSALLVEKLISLLLARSNPHYCSVWNIKKRKETNVISLMTTKMKNIRRNQQFVSTRKKLKILQSTAIYEVEQHAKCTKFTIKFLMVKNNYMPVCVF